MIDPLRASIGAVLLLLAILYIVRGRSLDRKRTVAVLIALFVSSLAISGYHYYYDNQALQIPLVNALNDRTLYRDDPFAATLPYYASTLWHLVAACSRIAGLENILFAGFLFTRALVIWAAGELATAFFPRSRLAMAGAMAFFAFIPNPLIGSGTLVSNYFEQTGLAVAFFLLATAYFYREKKMLWALCFGIGFNLNSMYGVYAATYFIASFVTDPSFRVAWRRWLLPVVTAAIMSSPAIALTLSAWNRTPPDTGLWLAASKLRFPHHLYPLTWGKRDLMLFALVTVAYTAVSYRHRHRDQKLFRFATTATAVSLAWLFCAYAAAYLVKSPALLTMHPARGTDLWHAYAGITLIGIYAADFEKERGHAASLRLAAAVVVCAALAGSYHLRERRMVFIAPPPSSVMDCATWALAKTPPEAVFLVDPSWHSEWEMFRAFSKRPVYATWRDGAAILWDKTFVTPWSERLRAIGFDVTKESGSSNALHKKLAASYASLRDEDVIRLGKIFGVSYWIAPSGHASDLPVVYEHAETKIMQIP